MFSYFTGLMAFAMILPVLFAFGRMILSVSRESAHLAASLFLLAGAYGWRTFWWDVLEPVLRKSAAEWGFDTLRFGLTVLNPFWNICVMVAAFMAIKCLHRMIPERDRGRWLVWLAWAYPPFRLRRKETKEPL